MSTSELIPMPALAAETWHRTLSKTDGRDKLFRLFQYLCKLLRGLDVGRMAPKSDTTAGKIAALETALGTSRQIWRLFKWASVYAKSRGRLSSLSFAPPLPDLAAVISDAAMFCYYIFDNITFLHRAKLINGEVRAASRRAARFWLVAVIAGLTGTLHNIISLHIRERKLRILIAADERAKKDDEETDNVEMETRRVEYSAVLRKKRAALSVVAKHSADSVVAWNLSREQQLHPAVVGACGVVSSLVGFSQVWPKYLPTE